MHRYVMPLYIEFCLYSCSACSVLIRFCAASGSSLSMVSSSTVTLQIRRAYLDFLLSAATAGEAGAGEGCEGGGGGGSMNLARISYQSYNSFFFSKE